jgi:hypothetical protein
MSFFGCRKCVLQSNGEKMRLICRFVLSQSLHIKRDYFYYTHRAAHSYLRKNMTGFFQYVKKRTNKNVTDSVIFFFSSD